MDTSTPKEIIVKLWDFNTLDSSFQKKYAAVFVQQDRKYVDMLLLNDKNCQLKLIYNPYSKVKFTLKNLQNNQVYGQASIVMRMLKGLKGKQGQVLALDDSTTDEILPDSGFRPSIELEYQWHKPASKAKVLLKSNEAYNEGLTAAQNQLQAYIDQLLALLKDHQEISNELDEDFIKRRENSYIESKIADQIQRVNDEKDSTLSQLETCNSSYSTAEALLQKCEERDATSCQKVEETSHNIDSLIKFLDHNIEEANEKNLQIRKSVGSTASLSSEQAQRRLTDEELRHKKKPEIDMAIDKIFSLEKEHLQELNKAASNKGLHDSEKATRIFDEVIKLDNQLDDPHEHDAEVAETREILDDKQTEVKLANEEINIKNVHQENLDKEYAQCQIELQQIIQKRRDQTERNLNLERLILQYELQEEEKLREIEETRPNDKPQIDIRLKTSKRITEDRGIEHPSRTKINTDKTQVELEPEKLSSALIGQKHSRDKARSDLEEGDSKWKRKINILYEAVEQLFTPTAEEMEQRAKIHELLDDFRECTQRTEQYEDELNNLSGSIAYLLKLKGLKANDKPSPSKEQVLKVQKAIIDTKKENNVKDLDISFHKARQNLLSTELSTLSHKRSIHQSTKSKLKATLQELKQTEIQDHPSPAHNGSSTPLKKSLASVTEQRKILKTEVSKLNFELEKVLGQISSAKNGQVKEGGEKDEEEERE
ncbi:unnamed protein product [Moneuplotes crassus]|uniref:Uncharacterized protein n=1 Tax=Euplotes crassus TaxID=5936 RepID=A0AAD1X317_EUPCR|nr:unnamed protein product [Moneuplotes crassus]